MRTINVLATQPISADDRAKIEASDPEIRLIDAGGWCDGEIGETWTAFAAARYLPPGATGSGSREERDRLLAEAEVIIGGWPFPLDLRARAPRLKWFHQRQIVRRRKSSATTGPPGFPMDIRHSFRCPEHGECFYRGGLSITP